MDAYDGGRPAHRIQRSPTGAKQSLRQWVLYHNPRTMGGEFFDIPGFDCLTNKRIRDLPGDIIWLIGRPSNSSKQYDLDSRFRVQKVEEGQWGNFRFRICASEGFLFFPPIRIDGLNWFGQLYSQHAKFSTGLQAVYDPLILEGLSRAHRAAAKLQT